MEKDYLKIGRAGDLRKSRERIFYRFFEILPGGLAWATLFFAVFFSWIRPLWVAFFIIAFNLYWFLRMVYLSFHQISCYRKMRVYLKIDWMGKLNQLTADSLSQTAYRRQLIANSAAVSGKRLAVSDIYHLIILPMHKEPYGLVKETFEALCASSYPKDKMIVVLGIEERAGEAARSVAEMISREYKEKFYRLLITIHPSNIEGELAGKGSNETWAAREAKRLIIDPFSIPYENIIVSSFDIDTRVYPHYFACLTYHFLSEPNRHQVSYQPVPLYNNNIWDAPAFSRVAAVSTTFWQMMQQERPEQLVTYSSHSMSFKSLVEMDFWQTNVVSEDSRIFWQSLLFYDGDYKVAPLFYPVSMDANLAPKFFQTLKNIYKQQRRWAYGSENFPYLVFGFLKNKKIPLRIKFRYGFLLLEGLWSWATASLLLFLLGWLPLWLGGETFNQTLLAYNLPRITRVIMSFAMAGMVVSGIINFQMLPRRPASYSRWRMLWMNLQWIFLPVNLIIFGAFPGLDGQTRLMLGKYMGFWVTEKHKK